ncbi:MAG: type VI-A CRISPR-associated RNA-guided ribonuclease Cas13a [Bacteroidales bacterium]|jgi:hypothetical protein|nr:type VI-A CRISPR-associated RNA-guided ribonuclease Cas13a [Bacteroidales bacterium]
MKVTKVKTNNGRIKIFRSTEKGKLVYDEKHEDETDKIFDEIDLKKSIDASRKYSNDTKDKKHKKGEYFKGLSAPTDEEINHRKGKLKKSIVNNKIVLEENLSKRGNVLLCFKKEFEQNGKIDFSALHSLYKVEDLAKSFEGKDLKSNFEVKSLLTKHQKKVFGKKQNPLNRDNDKLAQYNNEIRKYFEHYFPVSRKTNRKVEKDVTKYLNEKKIKLTIEKQFENAVRLFIQQLKRNTQETNSKTLSEKKRQEGFLLNVLGCCCFAANNFRNIVDKKSWENGELKEDILLTSAFCQSLSKDNVDNKLFEMFFGMQRPEIEGEKHNLCAARSSVFEMRNKSFHTDRIDSILEFFEKESQQFEHFIQKQNGKYAKNKQKLDYNTDPIFKSCLKRDIDNIRENIFVQLRSSGFLDYFDLGKIKELLGKITFPLCRSTIPFTPSFKKVFNKGCDYAADGRQYLKVNTNTYSKQKESETKEQYEARYFLLKMLYNNNFLSQYTKTNDFKKCINEVLQKNKEDAQEKAKKDKTRRPEQYGFEQINQIKEDETLESYFASIQSQTIIAEKNLKEKRKLKDRDKNQFEKFMLEVYVYAFYKFINNLFDNNDNRFYYEFVMNENKKIEAEKESIKSAINCKDLKINSNESTHICFYIFCKLLDSNHLSTLRNEITKFVMTADNQDEERNNLQHIFEIIELCLLTADNIDIAAQSYDENFLKMFVKGNISDYNGLYQQSDRSTLVSHSAIHSVKKYGTEQRLKDIVDNSGIEITSQDYKSWQSQKLDIENATNDRDKLHKEWVAGEQGIFKTTQIDEKKYEELCNYIENYNWLDNKLHFVHLKQLHNLMMEVWGRYVGFVKMFERDIMAIVPNKPKDLGETLSTLDGLSYKDKDTDEIKAKKDENFDVIYKYLNTNKNGYMEFIKTRNAISHFRFFNTETIEKSLLDYINDLRKMLSYDRKLKNAVTTAIIKIYDKHGFVLTLDKKTHTFTNCNVTSKRIDHLKGKVKINKYHSDFCTMCKTLLEMKKKG